MPKHAKSLLNPKLGPTHRLHSRSFSGFVLRILEGDPKTELWSLWVKPTVNPIKLETGLRPNSAGIPYTLLFRIEAMGFPTFGL